MSLRCLDTDLDLLRMRETGSSFPSGAPDIKAVKELLAKGTSGVLVASFT